VGTAAELALAKNALPDDSGSLFTVKKTMLPGFRSSKTSPKLKSTPAGVSPGSSPVLPSMPAALKIGRDGEVPVLGCRRTGGALRCRNRDKRQACRDDSTRHGEAGASATPSGLPGSGRSVVGTALTIHVVGPLCQPLGAVQRSDPLTNSSRMRNTAPVIWRHSPPLGYLCRRIFDWRIGTIDSDAEAPSIPVARASLILPWVEVYIEGGMGHWLKYLGKQSQKTTPAGWFGI